MRIAANIKQFIWIRLSLIACLMGHCVYAQPDDIQRAEQLYAQAFAEMQRIFTVNSSYHSPKSKLQAAKKIYQQHAVTDDRLANVFLRLGIVYDAEAIPSQALVYYLQAAQLKTQLQTPYDKDFAYIHILIGNVYHRIGKLDSAEYYYRKGEKLVLRLQSQGIDLLYLYSSLGKFYYNTGDCSASINYFEKAFQNVGKRADKRFVKVWHQQGNYLGTSLTQCGRYTEALRLYKRLLPTHYDPSFVRLRLGETYLKMHQPDNALQVLTQARFPTDTTLKIRLEYTLGIAYIHTHSYELAAQHLGRSIALNKKFLKDKNVYLAQAYIALGKVFAARTQKIQALSYYQQALQTLCTESLSDKGYPNPIHIDNVVSQPEVFEVLAAKADILRQNASLSDLKQAFQTYQLAIRLAEQLRLGYDSDEMKLFFMQQLFPVYQEAVQTAYHLYKHTQKNTYAEHAFFLSEKSKAAVLAESLHGLQLTHTAHLPATLLQQEREVKKRINEYTVAIATLPDNEKEKKTILQNRLRDTRIQWSELLKKMDANQKYYQLKYNTTPPSLAQLRKRLLTPKTALIEYFWADMPSNDAFGTHEKTDSGGRLMAFVITSNHLQMVTLPTPAPFRQALSDYHRSLFEHQFSLEQSQWAYVLYQHLFKPLIPFLNNCRHLIVVPDGELSRLPLESLVSDPETETYLLEGYIFRYAYSATVLEFTTRHHLAQPTAGTLAMAPFAGQYGRTFRTASLSPLPASKEEVEKIGGRIYLESQATKQVFLKMATHHGIIHLATHAKADSQSPLRSYISFYPQQSDSIAGYRLYTSELYNLTLDSVQLVVLSACETGGGQLVRGEGVMSLARAFAYAGCPNIMMTLWKAEDWATAQITTRMHEYLQKGYGKDEALTRAKRDYLREAPPLRKNPYFWANFVLVGDSEPVYRPIQWPYWVSGGLILVGLIVWFARWRKKNTI